MYGFYALAGRVGGSPSASQPRVGILFRASVASKVVRESGRMAVAFSLAIMLSILFRVLAMLILSVSQALAIVCFAAPRICRVS